MGEEFGIFHFLSFGVHYRACVFVKHGILDTIEEIKYCPNE